jgi:hypothetical protein
MFQCSVNEIICFFCFFFFTWWDRYVRKTIVDYEGVRKFVLLCSSIFVSSIFFCPDICFVSFSRDGSRNGYESAGKVQVKTVRITVDEKFVVKPQENPIRVCRDVHTLRETRRRTNGKET